MVIGTKQIPSLYDVEWLKDSQGNYVLNKKSKLEGLDLNSKYNLIKDFIQSQNSALNTLQGDLGYQYPQEVINDIYSTINEYNKQWADLSGTQATTLKPISTKGLTKSEILDSLNTGLSLLDTTRQNISTWKTTPQIDTGTSTNSSESNTSGTSLNEEIKTFTMPTEWQTLEDSANATIKVGMPTLDPASVNAWETKLEESYAPVREKLRTNMANYWASLFPQGGGSSAQAVKNMGQLTDFETNKLNTALNLAQTDLANKVSNYQNAQNILSTIGGAKSDYEKFGESLLNSNYWQNLSNNYNTAQNIINIAQQKDYYNKQAELASYLAEISKPKSMNFGEQLGSGLTSGLGTVLGYKGLGKLLALL